MTITLATLPEATAQEVYSQVRKHLLTQKMKSIEEGKGCVYRGPDGLMCAAGCLISDEEYREDMERQPWSFLVSRGLAPKEHKELIGKLQRIHDVAVEADWEHCLNKLAADFNLEPK